MCFGSSLKTGKFKLGSLPALIKFKSKSLKSESAGWVIRGCLD